MQRRWQLSPKPIMKESFTPSKGPEGSILMLGDRHYFRWQGGLHKLSQGLGLRLQRLSDRKKRLERIRYALIALCLIGAMALVVFASGCTSPLPTGPGLIAPQPQKPSDTTPSIPPVPAVKP